MTQTKSDKELAFLYDLYVATDWSERFASLIDAHLELPKKARVLYIGAGTGAHALALANRLEGEASLTGVDESEERIALAQAKQTQVQTDAGQTAFRRMQADALDFEDESFDAVICDATLVSAERLPEILSEMWRVADVGGQVALAATTRSSFGEFYSILWEALMTGECVEESRGVENLINESPLISDLEGQAVQAGFEGVNSWTEREEFEFASGEEFLSAPLVADFLLPKWFAPLALEHRERECVEAEIKRIIDDESDGAQFAFSIKATIITGQRSE
jgi:ubiquinone/menaquinone biosynthesis C-methylase UbiE